MNGDKEGEAVRVKKCPLLGEWCIQEGCIMWVELTQRMGGMVKRAKSCVFPMMMVQLVEINNKTGGAMKEDRIILPRDIRAN